MDSQKWQQHLALLREQYVNLYNNYTELQQKYALATAEKEDNGFVGRLLSQISALYEEQRYRYNSIAKKITFHVL